MPRIWRRSTPIGGMFLCVAIFAIQSLLGPSCANIGLRQSYTLRPKATSTGRLFLPKLSFGRMCKARFACSNRRGHSGVVWTRREESGFGFCTFRRMRSMARSGRMTPRFARRPRMPRTARTRPRRQDRTIWLGLTFTPSGCQCSRRTARTTTVLTSFLRS